MLLLQHFDYPKSKNIQPQKRPLCATGARDNFSLYVMRSQLQVRRSSIQELSSQLSKNYLTQYMYEQNQGFLHVPFQLRLSIALGTMEYILGYFGLSDGS